MPSAREVSVAGNSSAGGNFLLVVDAGGTKTAAWLVDPALEPSERVLGRGRAAAGNPLSVGFPEATRAIGEAAEIAKREANRHNTRVHRAVLSIAGSANEQLREQLIQSLRKTPPAENVAIVSDVLPILAAGTPKCHGVALIAGTGSVCLARAPDGRSSLSGGWGYLLGDEGSGYAIGRASLQFALAELEAKHAMSPLTTALLNELGANSTMDVTKTIYHCDDSRSAIASLAKVALSAADEGDSSAQEIIDSAAIDLAKLVARAVTTLGEVESPFPLAATGGVLVSSHRLQEQLRIALRRIGMAAELVVVEEPLEGCIKLAEPEWSDLLSWCVVPQ